MDVRRLPVVTATALALCAGLCVCPGLAAAPARAASARTVVAPAPTVLDGPVPVAGDVISLDAYLQDAQSGDALPGEPVEVQVRAWGSDDFRTFTTVTTLGDGRIHAAYVPRYNFGYRFVFDGDEDRAGTISATAWTGIGARVTLFGPAQVPRDGRLVVHGRTSPVRAGRTVRLYRGQTTRGAYGVQTEPPVLLASGLVHADGTYRLVGHPRWVGRRQVYVEVAGGGSNLRGWSPYRNVTSYVAAG